MWGGVYLVDRGSYLFAFFSLLLKTAKNAEAIKAELLNQGCQIFLGT
jgi:hypothetical protein